MTKSSPLTPAQTASPPNFYAYFMGFVGIVIFAATLPVTRLALQDFDPAFLTFSRALLGAVPSLVWLLATGRTLLHPKAAQIFVAGILLIFGFPGFMALAMTSLPASAGSIVLGIAPLATAAIATLIAGERQRRLFWLLATAGAMLVIGFIWLRSGMRINTISIGYLWMVFASLSAAFGYVISGKLSREMPGPEVIGRALVLNLPLLIAGTWWFYEPGYTNPSSAGLLGLIYLGLFSMFLGFFAWNTALARGGIGKIGQLQLLQVFITLAISAFLLHETIDTLTLITATLISAIIFLMRKL